MKDNTLYTVTGHKGAHRFIDARDTEAGTIADVQLIGAPLPFSAPIADIKPFTHADAMTEGDPITLLAQEAVTVYGLEIGRVQRAAEIARTPYTIQNARRDEMGESIKPSLKVLCVKGSRGGWYVVKPNYCQCPDNAKGNTCKHRIAAWIHREMIVRPLAVAARKTPAQIFEQLTA